MIPIPYRQVDEFLSWLSERHPEAALPGSEVSEVKDVLLEYLKTKGRLETLTPAYALRVFQTCPMIYEPAVREQMAHFVGCGGCLHYIRDRHKQYPRWVELHGLLEGFLRFCQQTQWAAILQEGASGFDSTWVGEGPEYADHLFREYIHRTGSDLYRAFEEYLETADPEMIRDYEARRIHWVESPNRPLRPSREWTEPLAISEGLEQAAERLIGSVYLLLEGQFYRETREDPKVYRILESLGLLSKNTARGAEFFYWVRHKYPELDLFGNVPSQGIIDLVLEYCEDRGYTDAKSFSEEVMGWVSGDVEHLILRRLAVAGFRARHDVGGGFPPSTPQKVSYSALFLFHSTGDFPRFIKQYWKDVNYLTARHLNLYYSLEDVQRKIADPEVLSGLRNVGFRSTSFPALFIWKDTLSQSRLLPLEGLSHENIFEILRMIVRKVLENAKVEEIYFEAQTLIEQKSSDLSKRREFVQEGGESEMKSESFPSARGAPGVGGDGDSLLRREVALRPSDEFFTALDKGGQNELAEALRKAKEALLSYEDLTEDEKQGHLQIINQIGEEAAKEKPNHTLLKSLNEGLKSTLKEHPKLTNAVAPIGRALEKRPRTVADTTKEIRTLLDKIEVKEKKRLRILLILIGVPMVLALALAVWNLWQARTLNIQTEQLQSAQLAVEEQRQAIDSIRAQAGQAGAASEQIRLGVIQYHARNFAAAIAAYDRAISIDPTNPVAYDLRGYALLRSGKPFEAVESLERSVELDPNYIWSHYDLALAYWAIGDTVKAIGEVRRVLELDSDFRDTIRKDGQFSAFRVVPEFRAMITP